MALDVMPLCIIQARMGSQRLPGKVLMEIGGMTLLERAWRVASEAFTSDHVVIAYPDTIENRPIAAHASAMTAQTFAWDGAENDVLGRFWACAHTYRWHPDSVIVRYTPDDWKKGPYSLRAVASGQRMPVEIGGEAFTLAQLDAAYERYRVFPSDSTEREHITYALFPIGAPASPKKDIPWSIDTEDDYRAACRAVEEGRA